MVVYGSRAQLAGVARGVSDAMLQQLTGTAWKDVGTVKPAKDGTVTLTIKPAVTTRYRLATGKVSAPSVRVPVAPLVRFYAPRSPAQLTGYVRPLSLAGVRVLIQRQQGPGWVTAGGDTVGPDGGFLAKLQLTDGVYRARVGSGHGHVSRDDAVAAGRTSDPGDSGRGARARSGAGGAGPPRTHELHASDPLSPRQYYLAQDHAFDAFGPELPVVNPVRVAVIDSGLDGGHPEFPRSRIWQARSWVGGSPLTDEQGHGTFVAGEIAAAINNNEGIAGMAFPGAARDRQGRARRPDDRRARRGPRRSAGPSTSAPA